MTFKYTMDKLLLNLRYHLTAAILQKFSTPFQNNNLKVTKLKVKVKVLQVLYTSGSFYTGVNHFKLPDYSDS